MSANTAVFSNMQFIFVFQNQRQSDEWRFEDTDSLQQNTVTEAAAA
jgi:hypothetical protein